jgi:hypothetical protein
MVRVKGYQAQVMAKAMEMVMGCQLRGMVRVRGLGCRVTQKGMVKDWEVPVKVMVMVMGCQVTAMRMVMVMVRFLVMVMGWGMQKGQWPDEAGVPRTWSSAAAAAAAAGGGGRQREPACG